MKRLSEIRSLWDDKWNIYPEASIMIPDFNWRRLHYLPESKRFPETQAEVQEILARYKTVLSELAQEQDEVLLLAKSLLLETGETDDYVQYLVTSGYDRFYKCPEELRARANLESGEDLMAFAKQALLSELDLDSIFKVYPDLRVIDPKVNNIEVSFIAADCSWYLAPYDGGMDFFALDKNITESIYQAHPDWQSISGSMW